MTNHTETHERPILFSDRLVRAILEGRKMQTRRPLKPQPPEHFEEPYLTSSGRWVVTHNDPPHTLKDYPLLCPYGQPGERLWVREAWCLEADPITAKTTERVLYRATDECEFQVDGDGFPIENRDGSFRSPWRPSIHMPRWASRLTLEVVEVRVQRLHEVGRDGRKAQDVLAEGITPREIERQAEWFHPDDAPAVAFQAGWDTIYKKRAPWAANPWVWAITFRRLEQPA